MVGHGSRGRGFGRGRGDIGLPREVYQRGAKDKKDRMCTAQKLLVREISVKKRILSRLANSLKNFKLIVPYTNIFIHFDPLCL